MTNTAYEIKFVSCDVAENPIAAVATVVEPSIPATGVKPLFVEAFAEDALGLQCAPSHSVTGSMADTNANGENGIASAGLGNGWTVLYPDYEGPDSEYAAGLLEGQVTLDSIIAAQHFAPIGLTAQTPVGMSGYSGGAIALSWAASIQKSYAPFLNIVGVALGGTPADPKGIGDNINTNTASNAAFFSIVFSGALGTNRAYPNFLTPIANAKGVAAAMAQENGCTGNNSDGSPGPTGHTTDYTTVSDFDNAPNVIATFKQTTLPQAGTSPIANLFVYHSQTDELIPISGADKLVAGWCAAGSTINYYRANSGDHISTEPANAQNVIAYLTARFGGTTPVYPATSTSCN